MAIKAKMRGGPINGKRQDIDSYSDRFIVREALPINYRGMFTEPEPYSDLQLRFREGDYARSNNKLKDGTVIYIWMGWRE